MSRIANSGTKFGTGPVDVIVRSIVPSWTSDILLARTSLKHWLVHGPIIFAGGSSGRLYTDSGVLDETEQPIPYIDGSCVQSPDHTRVMCRDVEFEFDSRAQRQLIQLSDMGASNVGVATSNKTAWFVIDGEKTYEGPWQIHRIPFGGGADEVVVSQPDTGTAHLTAMATDADLYVLRGCHELTVVNLAPGFATKTTELLLDGNGPCLQLLHFDDSYVYLNTGLGLIRMTHAEIQR